MSYVYKRGFGLDERFPIAPDRLPLESTGIVRETVVAPTRSQYEVAPTLIPQETVAAIPEPIPSPLAPLVAPNLVTVDQQIFPDSGWAPVAPPNPAREVSPYYTSGPAPIATAALTVEPVDSVAQSTRSITDFPLDSQMAAADANLQQQLLSRGMEATTAPSRSTDAPLPYTTPLTDSRFTDPYRDPARFVDASERPDMLPDYTLIPKAAPVAMPTRTAYVEDTGLTALPVEDVIVPQRELEASAPLSYSRAQSFMVPRAPDAIDVPSSRPIPQGACPAGWTEVAPGSCSANYQHDAGFDLPGEPETKAISPAEAAAACTAKGGNYMYDAASGQNVCLPAAPAAAPASGTPWLLIGAVGLAALFLLKR